VLVTVKKNNFLSVPKILGYCGFFIMSFFIFYAVVFGDFSKESSVLTSMPWGIVSLVDIYLGLILFSCWVIWREQDKRIASVWMLLILALGNVVSCLYILKAAYESDGNILGFWLGKQKVEAKNVF
jgi:uncharacterized protein DUF1475